MEMGVFTGTEEGAVEFRIRAPAGHVFEGSTPAMVLAYIAEVTPERGRILTYEAGAAGVRMLLLYRLLVSAVCELPSVERPKALRAIFDGAISVLARVEVDELLAEYEKGGGDG